MQDVIQEQRKHIEQQATVIKDLQETLNVN